MGILPLTRQPGRFRFKRNSNIGAADANDDIKFLSQSFVDTGDLAVLKDCTDPKCIVLGRTGAGKTALIEWLHKNEERSIKLDPENLALTYIANNGVLKFFAEIGVNLDIFYRLLWRHVFAVELIKARYHIVDEKSNANFFRDFLGKLSGNNAKQSALNYLKSWGEKFWIETDYRVGEITQKVERDLNLSAKGILESITPGFTLNSELNAGVAKRLSEEQKAELVQRGQKVVDQVQIAQLANVMKVLDEDILEDRQKPYYISIDRLDENWINDDVRYHVIRALIDTVRVFNNDVTNAKIVIAVREDLIFRVFKASRDPGLQEEKFRSMYLALSWNSQQLEELLDKRINRLIEDQYRSHVVTCRKLLPSEVPTQTGRVDSVSYMISRTMMRPRDLIMFFNECIRSAEGQPKITKDNLLRAEEGYSNSRLMAISDEWRADYPNLRKLIDCLKTFPSKFKVADVWDEFEANIFDFLSIGSPTVDETTDLYTKLISHFDQSRPEALFSTYAEVMYRVGIFGIKPESYTSVYWSWQSDPFPGVSGHSQLHIHPAFWRALGIKP